MKSVSVSVPQNLTLEQTQKVVAAVMGKVGHPTCFSGYKISFEDIVDPALNLAVEKGSLQVTERTAAR